MGRATRFLSVWRTQMISKLVYTYYLHRCIVVVYVRDNSNYFSLCYLRLVHVPPSSQTATKPVGGRRLWRRTPWPGAGPPRWSRRRTPPWPRSWRPTCCGSCKDEGNEDAAKIAVCTGTACLEKQSLRQGCQVRKRVFKVVIRRQEAKYKLVFFSGYLHF